MEINTVDRYMENKTVQQAIAIGTIYGLLVDKGIFTEDEYNELYEAMEEKTRENAAKELQELIEANPLYKMFV